MRKKKDSSKEIYYATTASRGVALIAKFTPLFSKPVWEHAKAQLIGVLLARGKRMVTACVHILGKSHEFDFQNYHRVLNLARWPTLAAVLRPSERYHSERGRKHQSLTKKAWQSCFKSRAPIAGALN